MYAKRSTTVVTKRCRLSLLTNSALGYNFPMRRAGGVLGLRLSAHEYSCAHHVTQSPNKIWRSTFIFNLWSTTLYHMRNTLMFHLSHSSCMTLPSITLKSTFYVLYLTLRYRSSYPYIFREILNHQESLLNQEQSNQLQYVKNQKSLRTQDNRQLCDQLFQVQTDKVNQIHHYVRFDSTRHGGTRARIRICKRLMSPGIDSKESIPPASVAWQAGTLNRVFGPDRQAGIRFLGSLNGLQIRALDFDALSSLQ